MERVRWGAPGAEAGWLGRTVACEARRVAPDGGGWLAQGQEPIVLWQVGGELQMVFSSRRVELQQNDLPCMQGILLETAKGCGLQRRKGETTRLAADSSRHSSAPAQAQPNCAGISWALLSPSNIGGALSPTHWLRLGIAHEQLTRILPTGKHLLIFWNLIRLLNTFGPDALLLARV